MSLADSGESPSSGARLAPGVSSWWVFVVALLTSSGIGAAITGHTYLSMLGHGHSLAGMLIWQIGSWSFWGLAAPFVVGLTAGMRRSGCTSARCAVVKLGALGLLLVPLHILFASQLALWVQPFVPMVIMGIGEMFQAQLATFLPVDILAYATLVLVGWAMAESLAKRQLELRESRLEAELAKARLEALRLEIQPHFLFNTLNTIAALVRLRSNDAALEMVVGLGDLMRQTLDRANDQQVSLASELDFTKRYVDLQRARFGERLDVEYRVPEACRDVLVPTFILQPLVENALRHGMGPRAQQCRLEIGAELADAHLHVWVSDDGVGLIPGFDLQRDARTGLGNTRSRLERLYGASARVTIERQPGGGTRASLLVPQQYPISARAAV